MKYNESGHSAAHVARLQRSFIAVAVFFRKNMVFTIALIFAGITCIFVPPDAQYLTYFDWKTLSCLFCTLAVICALKNIRFFTVFAQKIVDLTGNTRTAILALVYITFIGSLLIANDMALLTFLPLGYFVLSSSGKEKYMAYTFILQNISANLGGMLTPFGNPQNLYLYTKFHIPNGEFMKIMLPPFVLAVLLLTVCALFVHKEPLTVGERVLPKLPVKRTVLYLLLFILTIVIVFRLIPYQIGLVFIPLVLIFVDRKALKQVDYPLLLTFVVFFIFAGNLSRIGFIRGHLSSLLEKNTLLVTVGSCQVISSVPASILLSPFTGNYRELLLGVNIGGTGTLIASLASLITFREYTSLYREKTKSYLGLFTAMNFGFLAILLAFCLLLY